MGRETHRRLAMQVHTSMATLIARPSTDTYNQVSKILAILNRAGMVDDSLTLANDTMTEICDRYERVGKVGIKEAEATRLQSAAAGIDKALPLVPINKIEESFNAVEAFCASVGA